MPLGAHLPTNKGFSAALLQAQELGCETLQIFVKSPQRWAAPAIDPDGARAFVEQFQASGLHPLVAHDSYLINLASPNEELREKSIAAMVDEIDRCQMLGCHYLVTHCGAHCEKGGDETVVEAALARLVSSVEECLTRTPNATVVLCLENTAGQGTSLGASFEHLEYLLSRLPEERVGMCFDTCHAFAAGHDVVESLDEVVAALDRAVGLHRLKVVHLNDSKGALGKHLDRHEHIGDGLIGLEAMRALVNHPGLAQKPFILETPDTENSLGRNLTTVRDLHGAARKK